MSKKDPILTEKVAEKILDGSQRTFEDEEIHGKIISVKFNDKNKNKVIQFTNCDFHDLFTFNINCCHSVSFKNSKFFFDQMRFDGVESDKLKFENCSFNHVYFDNLQLKDTLEIDGCTANQFDFQRIGDILMSKSNSQGKALFFECPKTTIYYSKVSELRFISNVIEKAEIAHGKFDKIDFYNAKIKILKITGGNDFLEIEKIDFMDTLISGECKLNRLSLNDLILSKQRFVKDSSFKVENSKIKNKLYAFLVDLSYHSWQDIQFDKKCNLNLFNALFNGFTFASIIWPNKHLLNSNKLEHQTKEKFHWDKKEIYRQLKHLSKQNSNHLDALAFFRNEMIEYRKYVKETKELSRTDRFLIWVDHRVSDFGQNWIRPFVLMLLTPLILYQFIALIDYSLNDFQYLGEGCENYWKGIATFINPAHKLPETFNFGMILIDFLSRALTGFFIYHFIRATRRYGKV